MELKQLTEKFIEKFNIENIYQLKDKLLNVCLNNDIEIYDWYLKLIENDLSTDYLQKIFQYYEADRKEKMQDYTPKSLSKLISELTKTENEKWVYDCCSGSGALTIQKWVTNNTLSFICEELDENVIPFLLFNLSVRNINAYVANKNILTNEVFKIYEVKPSWKYSLVKEIEKGYELPKCDTTISNPPYNIPFDSKNEEIFSFGLPPKRNANYAFIQIALNKSTGKSALILPQITINGTNKQEQEIRKNLIESGLIESVISCPEKMFEATNIPVCILLLNRNKSDKNIILINAENIYTEEVRLQKGQYGGKSHTNRVYEKKINVFTDEQIKEIVNLSNSKKTENNKCFYLNLEEIRENKYSLHYGKYVPIEMEEYKGRPHSDILNDLNRVIRQKNLCKLTINETLAKTIGLDVEMYKKEKEESNLMAKHLKNIENVLGGVVEKSDFISFTKNKNELRFENNSKEDVSHILILIMQQWKNFVYFLNLEENRYLAELRDALLPDLMSGKINLDDMEL